MSGTSDKLFNYLQEIFYNSPRATLDLDGVEDDFVLLGKGLMYFAHCFSQYNELAKALAKGDLSYPIPPPENELAAPLKSLNASLKHLTWQSQQVAKGDYEQRVDFMGEFADAFNTMIEQLSERQHKLENEIELSRKKTEALEQSNRLLSNLMQYIPHQIFVVGENRREILLMNDLARYETENDSGYFDKLMELLPKDISRNNFTTEIRFDNNGVERYLSVNTYRIEWNQTNAEAFIINDVSNEKSQIKELEIHAYRDAMTHSYNRFYGMLVLNTWLEEKKRFSLVFLDLDNLKYINDKYGHNEGDIYIINTAKHLKNFADNAMVCRIGGDEFMLLVPDADYEEAYDRMNRIHEAIRNDGYQQNKDYSYSVSFGIVTVDEGTILSQSEVLSIADERMYENKRLRKMTRQEQQPTT